MDKDGIDISIIIPAYNASKYLNQCVQSITCQSELKFEIVLVDDGSTDGTAEICDELKSQDSRIKVSHQKNSGVSAARNAGLKVATGAYIMFVDADDMIENNTMKILLNKLNESQPDILFFGYSIKKNVSTDFANFPVAKEDLFFDKGEFLKFFAKNRDCDVLFYTFNSVWGKIIKRSVVSNCNFICDVKIGEDYLFNLACYEKSESFLFVTECLYNYIKREASATTRKRQFSDLKDTFKGCLATIEFYKAHKLLKHKKHLNVFLHKTLYNYFRLYFESGNSVRDLKKLTKFEKQILTISVIFSGNFHPKEFLFLLKCKISMF